MSNLQNLPIDHRPSLSDEDFHDAWASVAKKLRYRKAQKGVHAYASCHECLGILDEELAEFLDAVHFKDENGDRDVDWQVEELIDIAVAAIWSIASIKSSKVDW